jgi:hypothetical protein
MATVESEVIKMNNDITAERLRELLHYDPETGMFTWRVNRRGTAKAGTHAGRLNPNGYRDIMINGKRYKEHRIAWLYARGVMPTNLIDHINGIKDDNRIENLREATKSQNSANRGKPNSSTSGCKGVSWSKAAKKWKAQIGTHCKKIYLGVFTNIEDASAAYQAAALKYQGEFAHKEKQ